MGLCKYCDCWVEQCGVTPAHCRDRSAESFLSCDLTTDFRPFVPKSGLKMSREYIISKWKAHIIKMNGERSMK